MERKMTSGQNKEFPRKQAKKEEDTYKFTFCSSAVSPGNAESTKPASFKSEKSESDTYKSSDKDTEEFAKPASLKSEKSESDSYKSSDEDTEEFTKPANLKSEKSKSDTYKSSDEEEAHEFSAPWRNSDLVLVIEEQKLHVHRIILELASPVLCQLFKETDLTEVPLSRTKVNEFVDLLRVIYPQFDNQITLDNVAHIYRLAEEYQIEAVIKTCREYLTFAKKTITNAMKILVTAQVCKADEARQQCYKELQELTVAEMKSDQHFEDLDEQSLRNILLPKAERLEECLKKTQPQLVGLIDCVLYLWLHPENTVKMKRMPKQCPEHHSRADACTSMQTRIKCSACRAMFVQMATNSTYVDIVRWGKSKTEETRRHYSSTGVYFDGEIVNILEDMFNLLKIKKYHFGL